MCNFLFLHFQYTVCSISSNEILSSTIVFGSLFQYNMERIVSGVNNAEVCEIREQLCNKNGDGAADRRRPRPLITDNEVRQLITVIYHNSPPHLQSSELAAVTIGYPSRRHPLPSAAANYCHQRHPCLPLSLPVPNILTQLR